jgi:Zn ribbon nucleic-acid-binding protein
METIQANVIDENRVTFSCPHCERPFQISVWEYKNVKHKLAIRCSCNEQFQLLLNFRRFYRKNVILVGEAKNLSMYDSAWTVMTIMNLSIGGLRFKVLEPIKIQKGDKIRVRFTLDSPREEVVDKHVIVRNSRDNEFGCEFMSLASDEKEPESHLVEPSA